MKSKIIMYILCLVSVFSICSCKTKEYITIPVERIKVEYVHNTDSIYLHDSIFTSVIQKGDTIFVDKYKYKIKEVHKTDTIHKIDSIPVIKEIEKIIEVNKLYFWQKSLMWIGVAGLLTLIGGLLHKFKIWKLLF